VNNGQLPSDLSLGSTSHSAGFVTFGDGSLAHRRSAARVRNEVLRFPQFNFSLALNRLDLERLAPSEAAKIHWDERGLGFWAWKPLAALLALDQLPRETQFLTYLDGGFIINSSARASETLDKYLEKAQAFGGVAFSSGAGNTERRYSKSLTLRTVCRSSLNLDADQLAGGVWILHKNLAEEFLQRWWSLCQNLDLISDELFESEDPSFVEHRHDQSIFSILAKEANLYISSDNIDFNPANRKTGEDEFRLPFWAARHRSGFKSTSMSIPARALRMIEQSIR
jgi:hypothetical protein